MIIGCSQAPEPVKPAEARDEAKAPEAVPETPPAVAPAPSSPEEQPAEAAPAPVSDPSIIVIDPGGGENGDVDLVAAARAERERRAAAPRASRAITNQNLVKANPGEKPKAAGKPVAPAPVASSPDEAYWRGRSRELRQRWKDAVDELAALEKDADLLRRRFYEESDPYVRDGRIKPDWDRVLDRIREMRGESERRREELAAHLEEGRRAGALPGWLREGVELEPATATIPVGERPHEAIEPPIYSEPPETTDAEDGDG